MKNRGRHTDTDPNRQEVNVLLYADIKTVHFDLDVFNLTCTTGIKTISLNSFIWS